MAKGKGVRLQKYKDGGLADATTFVLANGLSWLDPAGRTRTEPDLSEWRAARATAGRMAPRGFPRTTGLHPDTPAVRPRPTCAAGLIWSLPECRTAASFPSREKNSFDRLIEVEQHFAPVGLADQALHPADNGQPFAACHLFDAVQCRGGVDDQITGGKLDRPGFQRVFDDQRAAVIAGRVCQKQRERQIGPHRPHDRVIDMQAIGLPGR